MTNENSLQACMQCLWREGRTLLSAKQVVLSVRTLPVYQNTYNILDLITVGKRREAQRKTAGDLYKENTTAV